jgi:hypothetical protein
MGEAKMTKPRKTERLGLRMTEAERRAIARLAKMLGTTQSEAIRRAVLASLAAAGEPPAA